VFDDPDNHRVLVVAGEAADYPGLIAGLQGGADASASFTLLVPGWPEAVGRAKRAADRMRAAGLELEETIVGDPDPFLAVGDVLHVRRFDEIIIADARKLTRHTSADLYTSVS
jgi:NH3-dependent NAD+ synthetase